MDITIFKENLTKHISHVKKHHSACKTEEASKTALILPMFSDVLGYNVIDPSVFVPEYVTDIGAKRGEKVDYAILRDNSPEILIEAKWSGTSLDGESSQIGYVSQLFRYFSLTSAKIGILTNGIEYRFYGDLDSNHQMDEDHFYQFNVLNMSEEDMEYLYRFHYSSFNSKKIIDDASEKKTHSDIKQLLKKLVTDPDNDFTGYIMKRLGASRRTKGLVQNYQPIVKQIMKEIVSEGITVDDKSPEIVTTQEELAAYYIIQTLIHKTIDPSRVKYKDSKTYFTVNIDGLTTHWICRLLPSSKGQWQIVIPVKDNKNPEKIILNDNTDLFELQNKFIKVAERYT